MKIRRITLIMIIIMGNMVIMIRMKIYVVDVVRGEGTQTY